MRRSLARLPLTSRSKEVDYWALGGASLPLERPSDDAAIAYECLVGFPPFCSESAHDTYRKILDWSSVRRRHSAVLTSQWLHIPEDVHLSRESEDLVRRMICSAETRVGRNSADEVKSHPFFAGVDWSTIRNIEAPFVPHLKSTVDTSYFRPSALSELSLILCSRRGPQRRAHRPRRRRSAGRQQRPRVRASLAQFSSR